MLVCGIVAKKNIPRRHYIEGGKMNRGSRVFR